MFSALFQDEASPLAGLYGDEPATGNGSSGRSYYNNDPNRDRLLNVLGARSGNPPVSTLHHGGKRTATGGRGAGRGPSLSELGPRTTFTGLENLGATCYLNSLIQTLFHTKELREGVYALNEETLAARRPPPKPKTTAPATTGAASSSGGSPAASTSTTATKSTSTASTNASSSAPPPSKEETIRESARKFLIYDVGFPFDQVELAIKRFGPGGTHAEEDPEQMRYKAVEWLLSGAAAVLLSKPAAPTPATSPAATTTATSTTTGSPAAPATSAKPASPAVATTTPKPAPKPSGQETEEEIEETAAAMFDLFEGEGLFAAVETRPSPPRSTAPTGSNSTTSTEPEEEEEEWGVPVGSIAEELQRLFAMLHLSRRSYISTSRLTRSFGWGRSETGTQHDAHELARVLLDIVDDSVRGTPQSQLVPSLYGGEMASYVKCSVCNYTSARQEKFLDVPVPVRGIASLPLSLESLVTPEFLVAPNQYHCEVCKKPVDAHKGQYFTKLPPILTFDLTRFEYNWQTDKRHKVNSKFVFPQTLDMTPFMQPNLSAAQGSSASPAASAPAAALANAPKSPVLYDLYSVIIHRGNAHRGHYHAYTRFSSKDPLYRAVYAAIAAQPPAPAATAATPPAGPANGKGPVTPPAAAPAAPPKPIDLDGPERFEWFDFNDSRITPISPEEVENTLASQFGGSGGGREECAYMLFYRAQSTMPAVKESLPTSVPPPGPRTLVEMVNGSDISLRAELEAHKRQRRFIVVTPQRFVVKDGLLHSASDDSLRTMDAKLRDDMALLQKASNSAAAVAALPPTTLANLAAPSAALLWFDVADTVGHLCDAAFKVLHPRLPHSTTAPPTPESDPSFVVTPLSLNHNASTTVLDPASFARTGDGAMKIVSSTTLQEETFLLVWNGKDINGVPWTATVSPPPAANPNAVNGSSATPDASSPSTTMSSSSSSSTVVRVKLTLTEHDLMKPGTAGVSVAAAANAAKRKGSSPSTSLPTSPSMSPAPTGAPSPRPATPTHPEPDDSNPTPFAKNFALALQSASTTNGTVHPTPLPSSTPSDDLLVFVTVDPAEFYTKPSSTPAATPPPPASSTSTTTTPAPTAATAAAAAEAPKVLPTLEMAFTVSSRLPVSFLKAHAIEGLRLFVKSIDPTRTVVGSPNFYRVRRTSPGGGPGFVFTNEKASLVFLGLRAYERLMLDTAANSLDSYVPSGTWNYVPPNKAKHTGGDSSIPGSSSSSSMDSSSGGSRSRANSEPEDFVMPIDQVEDLLVPLSSTGITDSSSDTSTSTSTSNSNGKAPARPSNATKSGGSTAATRRSHSATDEPTFALIVKLRFPGGFSFRPVTQDDRTPVTASSLLDVLPVMVPASMSIGKLKRLALSRLISLDPKISAYAAAPNPTEWRLLKSDLWDQADAPFPNEALTISEEGLNSTSDCVVWLEREAAPVPGEVAVRVFQVVSPLSTPVASPPDVSPAVRDVDFVGSLPDFHNPRVTVLPTANISNCFSILRMRKETTLSAFRKKLMETVPPPTPNAPIRLWCEGHILRGEEKTLQQLCRIGTSTSISVAFEYLRPHPDATVEQMSIHSLRLFLARTGSAAGSTQPAVPSPRLSNVPAPHAVVALPSRQPSPASGASSPGLPATAPDTPASTLFKLDTVLLEDGPRPRASALYEKVAEVTGIPMDYLLLAKFVLAAPDAVDVPGLVGPSAVSWKKIPLHAASSSSAPTAANGSSTTADDAPPPAPAKMSAAAAGKAPLRPSPTSTSAAHPAVPQKPGGSNLRASPFWLQDGDIIGVADSRDSDEPGNIFFDAQWVEYGRAAAIKSARAQALSMMARDPAKAAARKEAKAAANAADEASKRKREEKPLRINYNFSAPTSTSTTTTTTGGTQ